MRAVLIGFAALLLILALIALHHPDPLAAQFRYCGSGSISTLDPAGMSWIQDLRVAGLLYEGLMATDPATLRPRPAAAERVEVEDDGRAFTFTLRPDARWSNGEPVRATDFVYAWRRAVEPGTAADYAFFLEEIEGMREYAAWRSEQVARIGAFPPEQRPAALRDHWRRADDRFSTTVALQARGDRVLWMRLRRPVAYWLDVVSFAVTYPLHRASVERFRRESDAGLVFYDEQWAKPGATFYNGPYALTQWRFKRGLRLERNPHYWGRARYAIESVAALDVADDCTAWLMYSSGAIDWLPSIETSFAPALLGPLRPPAAAAATVPSSTLAQSAGARRDIHPLPAFGCYFYNFNCRRVLGDGAPNPFADARVRRAFVQAVDRDSLVTSVTRRGEPPLSCFIPPRIIPSYPLVRGLDFDPAAARAELAAAGYPDGRGFPTVLLLYTTDGDHGLIAESIAQMWLRNLNVQTRLVGKEVQSFREDKKSQQFMVCRAAWYGDYLDPTSFLDILRQDNGNNDSAYADPQYDEMLRAADGETVAARRLAALARAEEYVVSKTCPVLPLFQFVHVSAFDEARLRGFQPNARLVLSLRDVVLDP